jgi:hypothetical protein
VDPAASTKLSYVIIDIPILGSMCSTLHQYADNFFFSNSQAMGVHGNGQLVDCLASPLICGLWTAIRVGHTNKLSQVKR